MSKPKKRIRGFTVFLLVMLGVAVLLYTHLTTAIVDGVSMQPTFRTGDRKLVCKAYWLVGPIRKHDILVVKDDNKTGYMIKRVYALGGELVPWQYAPEKQPLKAGPYRVPDGSVYLMGDNRGYSEDCRKIGAVPLEKVIGKVIEF